MKRKGVLTEYYVGKKKYCSYVLGNDSIKINEKIILRGLNETIISSIQPIEIIPDFKNLSDFDFFLTLPTILHTACFLSLISINSKRTSLNDVLGDEGIIHEMTHLISGAVPVTDGSLKSVRAKFARLRKQAIGLY